MLASLTFHSVVQLFYVPGQFCWLYRFDSFLTQLILHASVILGIWCPNPLEGLVLLTANTGLQTLYILKYELEYMMNWQTPRLKYCLQSVVSKHYCPSPVAQFPQQVISLLVLDYMRWMANCSEHNVLSQARVVIFK